MTALVPVSLAVNGAVYEVMVQPRRLLSDVLREELGLSGTHVGCEHGVCGACTILIDGRPARSCLTFAVQMEGHDLTTIESIAQNEHLSPLQEAMHEVHGLQCGFCTPGIVITATAYLREHPNPDEAEVRDLLSGNLCRCTGYQSIVDAVMLAAAKMREQASG